MYKEIVKDKLRNTDIKINGNRPWDILVKDERFYSYVLQKESMGLGESYMFGWWECKDLEGFLFRIIRMNPTKKQFKFTKIWWYYFKAKVINRQTKNKSINVADIHYNIGNDLYEKMLGNTMIYSCGYWRNASDLDKAQNDKLDLICRKLKLQSGDRVLDIGCGWGGFAKYASINYGVEVVGITISEEQFRYARQNCQGLNVDIRLIDYRDIDEKFDKVASIGMFEHVGYKNYQQFMNKVNLCMKDDGLFLLHTIGSTTDMIATDPWIDKYIFPGGMIPSAPQIVRAFESTFVLEDWHSLGMDYKRTIHEWQTNFGEHWIDLKDKYGTNFYKMWMYYLSISAASFRAKSNNLWQIVLSKKGNIIDYQSER